LEGNISYETHARWLRIAVLEFAIHRIFIYSNVQTIESRSSGPSRAAQEVVTWKKDDVKWEIKGFFFTWKNCENYENYSDSRQSERKRRKSKITGSTENRNDIKFSVFSCISATLNAHARTHYKLSSSCMCSRGRKSQRW
jgi:hypothetical protein